MNRLLFIFLMYATTIHAQNVVEVEFQGQPLMYMKDGKLDGCGVRLVGINASPSPTAIWQIIDISFNIMAPGMATVKLSTHNTTMAAMKSGAKPSYLYVERGWIKAENKNATTPLPGSTFIRGEDKNSVLYVTSVESIFELFNAEQDRQQIYVGIRRRGDTFESIYSGRLALSPQESGEVGKCLKEFLSRF